MEESSIREFCLDGIVDFSFSDKPSENRHREIHAYARVQQKDGVFYLVSSESFALDCATSQDRLVGSFTMQDLAEYGISSLHYAILSDKIGDFESVFQREVEKTHIDGESSPSTMLTKFVSAITQTIRAFVTAANLEPTEYSKKRIAEYFGIDESAIEAIKKTPNHVSYDASLKDNDGKVMPSVVDTIEYDEEIDWFSLKKKD